MAQPTAVPGTINGDPVDRFTWAHAAVGVGYSLLGVRRAAWVVGAAVGWEVAERLFKDKVPALFPSASQDTFPNAIFDTLAVVGAWWATEKLRGKR